MITSVQRRPRWSAEEKAAIVQETYAQGMSVSLWRAGEADEIVSLFRGHYNLPLVHRDAGNLFLAKLAGIPDPEEKRIAIGANDRYPSLALARVPPSRCSFVRSSNVSALVAGNTDARARLWL